MKSIDADRLWQQLQSEGLVQGERSPRGGSATPWYVRVMLGIAGWIGALFILGFVGVGFAAVFRSAPGSLAVGAFACAGAVALLRVQSHSSFFSQFGFALSLAGQALLLVGAVHVFDGDAAGIGIAMTLLAIGLYLLIPDLMHRSWAAMVGAVALSVALWDMRLGAVAPTLVLAAFALTWLDELRAPARALALRPLGYGLAVVCLLHLCVAVWGTTVWEQVLAGRGTRAVGVSWEYWLSASGVMLVFVAVVWRLLGQGGVPAAARLTHRAMAASLLLALLSLKAPGVAAACTLLIVGFGCSSRVVQGLGVAGLLAYLSQYYYLLELTLLAKSLALICAGGALLLLRLLWRRWQPADIGEGDRA